MKGAIGNAFILNMVITFIIIFFMLLIGSMAYSKAYKTKNYLVSLLEKYEDNGKFAVTNIKPANKEVWDKEANEFLQKMGYTLSTNKANICKEGSKKNNELLIIKNDIGRYDYCVYRKFHNGISNNNIVVAYVYNYVVKTYMKMDLPIIGGLIRIPITGETKTYYMYE